MRDLVAGIVALALLLFAASLATTLTYYRRRRQRARDSERAMGRAVIVEIPGEDDLVLFSEDRARFYYGDRAIDKDLIEAVRILINGAPIAEARRPADRGTGRRAAGVGRTVPDVVEDRPEGIARDRWDVVIEAENGTTVVECGAIRERVSQELARAVYDAVTRAVAPGNHHSASGTPPR